MLLMNRCPRCGKAPILASVAMRPMCSTSEKTHWCVRCDCDDDTTVSSPCIPEDFPAIEAQREAIRLWNESYPIGSSICEAAACS